MQLGMVGLGRMGANLSRRLMRAGHEVVAYDVSPEAVEGLAGEGARLHDLGRELVLAAQVDEGLATASPRRRAGRAGDVRDPPVSERDQVV